MREPSDDLFNKIPIFSRFTNDERSVVNKHIAFLKVGEGEVLFNEGDKGDSICFVVDGRLNVIKKTYTGEEIIINTLSRGQSFGEMAIIENSLRSATIRAESATTLITLNREGFDMIMNAYPQVGSKILKGISLLLSKKLRQTSSRLIGYMTTAG
jgi:CRP/FNR family transcriptional regulator, cyclic AMP receptor protein